MQSSNKEFISSTFVVLKYDKSIEVKDIQWLNIYPILLTLFVLSPERLIEVKELQNENK